MIALEPAGALTGRGVHWPHQTRAEKNLVMRQAARTMQVAESMTTTEPEPSMEPVLAHLVLAERQVDGDRARTTAPRRRRG